MHSITRTLSTLAAGLSLASLAGCGLEPLDDEGGDEIPPAVQQAFTESCATSTSCHASGAPQVSFAEGELAGVLSQTGATGVPFVTLGDVDNSYVAEKILGLPSIAGGVMPPLEQSPNDEFNTAIIVAWIAGVEFEGGADGTGDTGETGDTGGTGGDPVCYADALPDMVSFETDVWPVLEARCTGDVCHDVLAPMMPDATGAYANLVGVDAPGPGIPYVDDTGAPDNSYLWHKLAGTQSIVGGGGGTMPATGELCLVEAQLIYRWILDGAAP